MQKLFLFLLIPLTLFAEMETDKVLPRLDPVISGQFYTILGDLSEACQEVDMPIWLVCGSLLGALRHDMMIPWDDDIDIGFWIDDLPKLINRREAFEAKGYQLLIMKDYIKLFPKNGKEIPGYPWRYPFIDLFPMEEIGGIVSYASPRLRAACSARDWFTAEDLRDPLPYHVFGPHYIAIPRSAVAYLERLYGNDCWEIAYASYDHANEQPIVSEKVKIVTFKGFIE